MRIELDSAACEANAACTAVAPDVFELDDDEYLHVAAAVAPARHDAVRRAVAACPKRALRLVEP